MTPDESELRAMTDTTPSPPDILTRLREHVLHFIGLCMPETRQLLLDAAAEIERLRGFETAYRLWQEKTEWVQDEFDSGKQPVRRLGWHRADIMRAEIEDLRLVNSDIPQLRATIAGLRGDNAKGS